LVLAEGAGLAQQLVDEGGLAVVDVGDDGDVADGAGHGGGKSLKGHGFYHGLRRRSMEFSRIPGAVLESRAQFRKDQECLRSSAAADSPSCRTWRSSGARLRARPTASPRARWCSGACATNRWCSSP